LQAALIAGLAMRKGILAHMVQRIPVAQLRLPQGRELFRGCMQLQFGGQ
jgi:hypothetical protein